MQQFQHLLESNSCTISKIAQSKKAKHSQSSKMLQRYLSDNKIRGSFTFKSNLAEQ